MREVIGNLEFMFMSKVKGKIWIYGVVYLVEESVMVVSVFCRVLFVNRRVRSVIGEFLLVVRFFLEIVIMLRY